MAEAQGVKQKLYDAIDKATESPNTYEAQALKDLAEAYAWIVSPAQPHGGSSKVESGSR